MKRRSVLSLGVAGSFALPVLSALYHAQDALAQGAPLSAADRTFVAKVSQGGMFEVMASKLAESKATERDVADLSVTEVHDHTLVGAKLKGIALALGLPFPAQLNASFRSRLDRLSAVPAGRAFDVAYIEAMDAIHATDVAAFAEEAASGTNPQLRAFAAETVLIVRRHIGALHAVPLPTM